jgi:dephospho-CoA kinase
MIKAGITGGIGSGKSHICRVFSTLGIPVYNADEAARNLMIRDESIKTSLTAIFGKDLYAGGTLNRQMLGDLIFTDPGLLAEVNRIVHPRVGLDFSNWCSRLTGFPFVIQESALIFEIKATGLFDCIILVTAPEKTRINRLMERPGMTRQKIMKIMRNQLPEKEKIVRSHFVIKNDGTLLVLPHILKIYTELSHKATE